LVNIRTTKYTRENTSTKTRKKIPCEVSYFLSLF